MTTDFTEYMMLAYGIEVSEDWYQDQMNDEDYANFLAYGDLTYANF